MEELRNYSEQYYYYGGAESINNVWVNSVFLCNLNGIHLVLGNKPIEISSKSNK